LAYQSRQKSPIVAVVVVTLVLLLLLLPPDALRIAAKGRSRVHAMSESVYVVSVSKP
jgi:hypothetical protein